MALRPLHSSPHPPGVVHQLALGGDVGNRSFQLTATPTRVTEKAPEAAPGTLPHEALPPGWREGGVQCPGPPCLSGEGGGETSLLWAPRSALGCPQGHPRTTHRREGLGCPQQQGLLHCRQADPRPSPSPAEEGPGDPPKAMAESGWGPAPAHGLSHVSRAFWLYCLSVRGG